jgi:hypothetical protein
VRYNRREKTGGQLSQVSLSTPNAAEPSTMPFAQRLTCTIDDACEVTGLGRTKLYELIGAGRIVPERYLSGSSAIVAIISNSVFSIN